MWNWTQSLRLILMPLLSIGKCILKMLINTFLCFTLKQNITHRTQQKENEKNWYQGRNIMPNRSVNIHNSIGSVSVWNWNIIPTINLEVSAPNSTKNINKAENFKHTISWTTIARSSTSAKSIADMRARTKREHEIDVVFGGGSSTDLHCIPCRKLNAVKWT